MLRGQLFGVSPEDPLTFAVVAGALAVIGGVLGLVGYLFVFGFQPNAPRWIRRSMLGAFGATALVGVIGFRFIGNDGHAGGALTGMLVGLLAARSRSSTDVRVMRTLDALGWIAVVVLIGAAVFTARRLLEV